MRDHFGRRDFLKASAAAGILHGVPFVAAAQPNRAADFREVGNAEPFDFERLCAKARALAQSAHREPSVSTVPGAVRALDWDQYQSIRFRPDRALWAHDHLRFRVKFFHLGRGYLERVRMYEVESGVARELAYADALFDYGQSGLSGARLPPDLGFAGFQLACDRDFSRDVAAFLGASYFRAVGGEFQYGLSARALAIDCGLYRPEEFPRFTSFYFERPNKTASEVTVHALLDSKSVAGAYRFRIQPDDLLVMQVDARIYLRKPVQRLGIAPLTSMFQYGENDRRVVGDWRPEIHDSDGLCLHTGRDEWIFRPLTNPARLRFNAYLDENPRGFGLLQRDRDFDHYQDDGVFYDKRPNLWVEPLAGWGKGSVQLVELPTADETNDNIVAFWSPSTAPEPGRELALSYRLHWGSRLPNQPALARALATRTGPGGVVGRRRKYFSWRFVVDFGGGELSKLPESAKVEPTISTSRGTLELTSARVLRSIHGYRVMFDLRPMDDDPSPVDLRMFLHTGDRTLTETWMYQWNPPERQTT